jgi:O-antigen ligase
LYLNPLLKKIYPAYSTIVVCLSVIMLTLPANGYNFPIALLLLLGPVCFDKNKVVLKQVDYYLIALLAVFFIFYMAQIVFRPEPFRLFDRNIRWLIFIGIFICLLKYPPNKNVVLASIMLGSLSSGIFAMFEKLETGTSRVGNHINPIQFGAFAMLLALLSGVIANHFMIRWLKGSNKSQVLLWLGFFAFACAFLGLYASILSGSRGAWLCAPLFIFAIYKQYSAELGIKKYWFFVLLIIVTSAGCLAYNNKNLDIAARIGHFVTESNSYYNQKKANTSVGARLEMWRVTAVLISERPLLGWGHQGYQNEINKMVESKEIDSFLAQFNEPHNQFLDAAVKHGLIGLILMLFIHTWSIKNFLKRYQNYIGSSESLFGMMGAVSIIAFIGFSLTHSFINKTAGLMIFLFNLTLFWSLSINRKSM